MAGFLIVSVASLWMQCPRKVPLKWSSNSRQPLTFVSQWHFFYRKWTNVMYSNKFKQYDLGVSGVWQFWSWVLILLHLNPIAQFRTLHKYLNQVMHNFSYWWFLTVKAIFQCDRSLILFSKYFYPRLSRAEPPLTKLLLFLITKGASRTTFKKQVGGIHSSCRCFLVTLAAAATLAATT